MTGRRAVDKVAADRRSNNSQVWGILIMQPHSNYAASRQHFCRLRKAALTLAGLTCSTLSMAASTEQVGGLEEIVVTARHVTENLQTTPISISAVTAADLDARGVTDIAGLASSAPNVTLGEGTGGFGKSAVAYIRGVGQHDALPAFEPAVGFYLNDVYHGTLFGAPLELTDIDHVEILRGPQGTLFGKSNEGGAVRIFTPEAKGTNTGYVQFGYGSYDHQQIRGAFDWALVPDKLMVRIGGGSNSIDGYVKQVDFVCAHPDQAGTLQRTSPAKQGGDCVVGKLGGSTTNTGRLDLRYVASDTLTFKLAADVTTTRGSAGDDVLIAINPAILGDNATQGPPTTGTATSPYGIPFDSRFIPTDKYSTYVTFCDQQNGLCFPNRNDMKSWGVASTIDWTSPFGIHVKNVAAYREYRGEFVEIWAAAPWHINDNYFRPYHNQVSEELTLSGKAFNDALEWTVGGYYYRSLTELNDYIYIAFAPGAFDGNPAFYGRDPVRDEDISGFVHGLFHVTDKFGIEAGVRHTDTSKEYTFNRLVDNPSAPPSSTPVYLTGFDPELVSTSSTSRFDYRLALQYQWTSDVMSYASFATGFKGPGVNPRPSAYQFTTAFKEEDLRSFELGTKAQWLDDRLRTNLAAFLSNYTDLQLSIPVNIGGVPGSTVSNAGKVQITGLEAEVQAELAPRLLVDASGSWLKYDIKELGAAEGVAGGPAEGDISPYVPERKAAVGIQYTMELGDSGSFTPRLDYTWQSKSYADPDNNVYSEIPSYGLANLHLTWDSSDSQWQARLDINNATDKFYWANVYSQYNAGGMVVGRPGMPRSYFLTIKRSF